MRRLDQLPVYEERRTAIPAARFNQARLGLRRIGNPLRLPLAELRHLELVLSDDAWVCVDTSLDDMPVLAWSHFAPRTELHRPVACRLRLYHQHAGLIIDRVGRAMDTRLAERLAAAGPS